MMVPARVLKSPRLRSYIFVLITVAIWGISTPVIKSTVAYIPPMSFLAIRFWIAGIITIPVAIYYFRHHKINKVRFKHIISASFIGHIAALALIFLGLERTSAIEGSVITTFSPLLISVLGFFFLKEIITKKEIEGTLIAFLGTLIIIVEPIISGRQNIDINRVAFSGNMLFLGGIVLDAFYSIYTKKHISDDKIITPFMQISISFVIAAIAFTPLALFEQYSEYTKDPINHLEICRLGDYDKFVNNAGLSCNINGCHSIDDVSDYTCKDKSRNFTLLLNTNLRGYFGDNAIWGVLYMSILSGLIAYTLYSLSLEHIEASEASLFYYMQPIFGIPVAVFFLKEHVSSVFLVGAVLTALGIYLAEKRKRY